MKKVLLIDSGTGGANILLKCLEVVPCCDFLLFCDNENLPYGNKTRKQLIEITLKNLDSIKTYFDFEIVIFACNTLTATAIDKCREVFKDVVFIGTEPAILPALKSFNQDEICVLATRTTIENNNLCKKYDKIECKALNFLASEIDKNLDEIECLQERLKEEFSSFDKKAIVLGCTHYTTILNVLENILPNVTFFSSEEGVARRLKSIVGDVQSSFQVQVITSKNDGFRDKILWYLQRKSKEF